MSPIGSPYGGETSGGSGGSGLTESEVDARINVTIPVARRIPAYDSDNAKESLTVADDGNSVLFAPTVASALEVRTALPNVNDFHVGDIINFNGDLYELVDATKETNVFTSIANQRASINGNPYAGTETLEWRTDGGSPLSAMAHLDRTILGPNPPAAIVVDFSTSKGFVANDIYLTRNAARDNVANFAYSEDDTNLGGDSPGFGGYVGAKFTATFYVARADESKGAALQVRPNVNKWELAERDHPTTQTDYPDIKNIIVDGRGIRVTAEDETEKLLIASRATEMPFGTVLPQTDIKINELFRLTEDEANHPADRVFRFVDGATTAQFQVQLPDTQGMGVEYFSSDYAGQASGALKGNVTVNIPPGQLTNRPSQIALYPEGDPRVLYTITQAPVTGTGGTLHIVQGISASDLNKVETFRINLLGGSAPTYTQNYDAGIYRRGGIGENAWVLAHTEQAQVNNHQSNVTPSKAATVVASNGTVQMDLAIGFSAPNQGISVSNHDIIFANSGLYAIDYSFQIAFTSTSAVIFADARNYIDLKWSRTRNSVDTALLYAGKTLYARGMAGATGQRLGPNNFRIAGTFKYVAEASDHLFVEMFATFIQNANTSIEVISGESQIAIFSQEIL